MRKTPPRDKMAMAVGISPHFSLRQIEAKKRMKIE